MCAWVERVWRVSMPGYHLLHLSIYSLIRTHLLDCNLSTSLSVPLRSLWGTALRSVSSYTTRSGSPMCAHSVSSLGLTVSSQTYNVNLPTHHRTRRGAARETCIRAHTNTWAVKGYEGLWCHNHEHIHIHVQNFVDTISSSVSSGIKGINREFVLYSLRKPFTLDARTLLWAFDCIQAQKHF